MCIRDRASSFALYEAVFIDFEKVKLLITKGADVNYQTETTKGDVYKRQSYKRDGCGKTYVFSPLVTRAEYTRQAMKEVKKSPETAGGWI